MSSVKKRIVFYLSFILLGATCVCLTCLIAGFAAYQKGNGPPSGYSRIGLNIIHHQSRYDEIKAMLQPDKEGKLITEEEYMEFVRLEPRTEMGIGDESESKSVLCFATKTWALRVFFNDKGIAIAHELRW